MPARPRPPVGNVSVVVPFRSVYPSPFAVLELYVVVRAVHHGINVAAGHARRAARHDTQARPLARMLHSVVQRDSHSTDVRARLAVLAGFVCSAAAVASSAFTMDANSPPQQHLATSTCHANGRQIGQHAYRRFVFPSDMIAPGCTEWPLMLGAFVSSLKKIGTRGGGGVD